MHQATLDPNHVNLPRDLPALVGVIRSLESWGDKRDWLGPDPYEGLNAERVPILKSTRLGRRVLVQAVKRSPLDLRRPLRVPPARNSVAAAQLVSTYARRGFLPDEEQERKLRRALSWLLELRCAGYEQPCWSYHFDLETRVCFYPKTMPNTIATSFAGMALLDAYEQLREPELLELARGVGDFFLTEIPQTITQDGAYFGYFIGDRSPIHNANMLACGFLARLGHLIPSNDFRREAESALAYCLARQHADGGWHYGELPALRWVDNFHTGYILDALLECVTVRLASTAEPALKRGLNYYRTRLFLPDGTPKYFTTALYPVDAQCAAQGIQTFARATAVEPELEAWSWKVFRYAVTHMRRPDGAFVFQRRRFWRNSTPHIRWVQAPMLLALVYLMQASQSLPGRQT